MRISDWSSDVCSSDLTPSIEAANRAIAQRRNTFASAAAPPVFRYTPLPRRTAHDPRDLHQAFRLRRTRRRRLHAGSTERRVVGVRSRRTAATLRSEEHTSELQSLMRISYAVFCLKKKKYQKHKT